MVAVPVKRELHPCWWCGNPDVSISSGMYVREPPGAAVTCSHDNNGCGAGSPWVWRDGKSYQWAKDEAARIHNQGPRPRNGEWMSVVPVAVGDAPARKKGRVK